MKPRTAPAFAALAVTPAFAAEPAAERQTVQAQEDQAQSSHALWP